VWTTKALKKYVDARIADLRDQIGSALGPMDKRLDGMNEFRDALKDQTKDLATKRELDALDAQVQELRIKSGGTAGKDEQLTKYIGWILAAAALAIAFWK
jgi:hypothetical protein